MAGHGLCCGGLLAGLFVSGFPAMAFHALLAPLWGLVCGVCGVGLLFENYIVDASIFHEEPFGVFRG